MTNPSLRNTMNTAAWPHEPELEKRLIALEKRGPAELPPRDICRLIQFIKYAVLAQCKKDNSFVKDSNGNILALPDNGFQREISAIRTLQSHLHFSNTFHEWVDDRLRALAHRMAREHNADAMKNIWKQMDENGRYSYLRTLHAVQIQLFSDDLLAFKQADVQLQKMSQHVLGEFSFGGNPLQKNTSMKIAINPAELHKSTHESAAGALVHETLHCILRQLVPAHHHKDIQREHPLHKDSALIHDYALYDCYTSSFFREAYKSDLEERLCHKHETYQALYEAQSARRRNLTDRVRMRPQ